MGVVEESGLLQRHRLSVADYYRMAEAGVLAQGARVELIKGEIVDMPPMRSRHAAAVGRLMRRLVVAVGERALVTCQTPLRLDERSELEPDLMVIRLRADDYSRSHPGAADVLLLIEVSDSSSRYDREIKLPMYARHGVVEVWIVDLDNGLLSLFRQPAGDGYADIVATEAPAATAITALPGVSIDLCGILL